MNQLMRFIPWISLILLLSTHPCLASGMEGENRVLENWSPEITREGVWKFHWNRERLEGERVSERWVELFPGLGFGELVKGESGSMEIQGAGETIRIALPGSPEAVIDLRLNPTFYTFTESGVTTIFIPCMNGILLDDLFNRGDVVEIRNEPKAGGGVRRVAVDAKSGGTTILIFDVITDPGMEIPQIDFEGEWDAKLTEGSDIVFERLPATCGIYSELVMTAKGNRVSLVVCGDILYFVADGKICSGAILLSDLSCGFCIRKTVNSSGEEYSVYAEKQCINQIQVPCAK